MRINLILILIFCCPFLSLSGAADGCDKMSVGDNIETVGLLSICSFGDAYHLDDGTEGVVEGALGGSLYKVVFPFVKDGSGKSLSSVFLGQFLRKAKNIEVENNVWNRFPLTFDISTGETFCLEAWQEGVVRGVCPSPHGDCSESHYQVTFDGVESIDGKPVKLIVCGNTLKRVS